MSQATVTTHEDVSVEDVSHNLLQTVPISFFAKKLKEAQKSEFYLAKWCFRLKNDPKTYYGGCEGEKSMHGYSSCPWHHKAITGAFVQCFGCNIYIHANCLIGTLEFEEALTKKFYCAKCNYLLGFHTYGN